MRDQFREDWALGNRFVVLYAGNLGRKQGLDMLIEAAHRDVAGHTGSRGCALVDVAAGKDDPGPDAGEFTSGDETQAAVGTGDDGGPTGEGWKVCCGPTHGGHCSEVARALGGTVPNYFTAMVNPLMICPTSGAWAAA